MNERPIKLTIAALGGQGGGVLADWLIDVAETQNHLVQSTSVPGVAQRTGATIYYLEFFPRDVAQRMQREPVMALMPAPGDVDCVVASELAEAGRAIVRGLVTPERTTLIASSHRAYTIAERSALGDGAVDAHQLAEESRKHARRLIMFDMEALAARHESFISSVMLGAIAGSRVLPFSRESFETAIRHGGVAVATNLAAFADAFERATKSVNEAPQTTRPRLSDAIPERARSAAAQPLLERVRTFAPAVQPVLLAGVRRLIDYQDVQYAALYLERVAKIAAGDLDEGRTLTQTVAQHLALWMSFEDTIRVADLKTRRARFERVRDEVRIEDGQLLGVTEFMKPRLEEIAGTMPAGLGRRLERSPGMRRALARMTVGRHIRTSTVRGFLFLRVIAALRRIRRATLRFQVENGRIERWLETIEATARESYSCAVEIARLQRLVKGYGETHERGWRNFEMIMSETPALVRRADGAALLARLHAAALADEEGAGLQREVAALGVQGRLQPRA